MHLWLEMSCCLISSVASQTNKGKSTGPLSTVTKIYPLWHFRFSWGRGKQHCSAFLGWETARAASILSSPGRENAHSSGPRSSVEMSTVLHPAGWLEVLCLAEYLLGRIRGELLRRHCRSYWVTDVLTSFIARLENRSLFKKKKKKGTPLHTLTTISFGSRLQQSAQNAEKAQTAQPTRFLSGCKVR